MTKVAIHQSQYLPWPPYFKKIAAADVFVVMDNVQFQKNGVQNRNKIRNYQHDFWLTIPISGSISEQISEKKIASPVWQKKHWNSIQGSYRQAPMWKTYEDELYQLYNERTYDNLIDVNREVLHFFLRKLKIPTKVVYLSELGVQGKKSDLVLNICKHLGASTYISGLGGKDYLREQDFSEAGIEIVYEPSIPPEYEQFHGEFIPGLSALDYLMNVDVTIIHEYLFGETLEVIR